MQYRRAIFDGFLCLSLTNLLFLRVWAQLLPAVVNRANLYYIDRAPEAVHYPGVLVSMFGVGSALAVLLHWGRRSSRPWAMPLARSLFLLLFLGALNAVRGQIPEPAQDTFFEALTPLGAWALGIGAAALLAWGLHTRAALVFGAIEIFAIFASPFLLMTVGQAVWTWSRHEPDRFAGAFLGPGETAMPLLRRSPTDPRVVWILFDELDQNAAFDARPDFLELPEFDRFARKAFVASNAFSPEGETRRSVASMLLGKQVAWALPSGESALPCRVAVGRETIESSDCWSQHENLFRTLREVGVDSGVAGWYHPYCRLFPDVLVRCAGSGLPYWGSATLAESFGHQWEEVIKSVPIARDWLRPGVRIRRAHVDSFAAIRRAALEFVADPSLGFVLLHFPVPHHPDIYDPVEGTISTTDRRSYFDNLVLADRTFGEIRAQMESAGVWEASTVVVTSDHWWRAIHRGDWGLQPEEAEVFGDGEHRRIPFLVKFPGQGRPASFAKPFNTILLHGFTLRVFAGEIATPAQAAAYLDGARRAAPVPYLTREQIRRAQRPQAAR